MKYALQEPSYRTEEDILKSIAQIITLYVFSLMTIIG